MKILCDNISLENKYQKTSSEYLPEPQLLSSVHEKYFIGKGKKKNFFFLRAAPSDHMEVPRLDVKSELYLPAYTTATATWDCSHVCDLHRSSQQCRIPEQGQGSNPCPH